MPKRKSKKKRGFFRPVHLHAFLITISYLIISKLVFVRFVADGNICISFLGPFLFGSVVSVIFLYLFNHEDFFHFIKEIEKEEEKKEKNYLKKYARFGKIIACLVVGAIGGPIFSALTIRFLLGRIWYRYLVLVFSGVLSTIASVGIAKGFLDFLF